MAQNTTQLEATLFSRGEPSASDREALLKQYELFVGTTEALASRRQVVNTFFLSANSLILAAAGILWGDIQFGDWESLALAALGYAGMVLCFAWRSLIKSFRQLSQGKFNVIHGLERHLPARIFEQEWIELGQGKDPQRYTPFTKTESKVPWVFGWGHFLVFGVSLFTLVD